MDAFKSFIANGGKDYVVEGKEEEECYVAGDGQGVDTLCNRDAVKKAASILLVKDVEVVLFHGNCMDGLFAALAIHKVTENLTFVPLYYNQLDMDNVYTQVAGRNVAMLDFSFAKSECDKIKGLANKFLVLDHHQTAEDNIGGADYACIDQRYSGAVLAEGWAIRSGLLVSHGFEHASYDDGDWLDYWVRPHTQPATVPSARDANFKHILHRTNEKVSLFALYVGDRDIWNWFLPFSKEMNAAMTMRISSDGKKTFKNAAAFVKSCALVDTASLFTELYCEGKGIVAAWDAIIKSSLRNASYEVIAPEGIRLVFINTPTLVSETADYALKYGLARFGVTESDVVVPWWYQDKSRKTGFSFRSKKRADGKFIDVSKVAVHFGGGGHPCAAGAQSINGPPADVQLRVVNYFKSGAVKFE